jgi:hypothetical protein
MPWPGVLELMVKNCPLEWLEYGIVAVGKIFRSFPESEFFSSRWVW